MKKNFFHLFPFLFNFKLKREKKEILRGLEGVTLEEIEAAGKNAVFSADGAYFLLRGIKVSPYCYMAGGGTPTAWSVFAERIGGRDRRRHYLKGILRKCIESPEDASRQRAYLLGLCLSA